MHESPSLWSDLYPADGFQILRQVPVPPGLEGSLCTKCGSSIIAAIVIRQDGNKVIDSSDDADPEIACQTCGYWRD
jgi:DNA-directed RNA polymerase subunit RPC12/RpoP